MCSTPGVEKKKQEYMTLSWRKLQRLLTFFIRKKYRIPAGLSKKNESFSLLLNVSHRSDISDSGGISSGRAGAKRVEKSEC